MVRIVPIEILTVDSILTNTKINNMDGALLQ